MMTNYGEEFYSTRYNVGEFFSMAEKWGPEAYIFYDAMETFQKETGIGIDLYYFMQTKDLLTALEENFNNEKCPDIIVGSYTTDEYCLYSYITDGYFADMKPYFVEDELYTNGEYLTNVLNGGLIGDKQYIFPLTFNMNMFFSSKESLKSHDLWLSDEMTYSEMLTLFAESWKQESREDEEVIMMQFSNSQNTFPNALFQSASGESILDYETGEIVLDEEYFGELARLYESYLCDDYDMTREELKELAHANDGVLPYNKSKFINLKSASLNEEVSLEIFNIINEKVGCFSEGGYKSVFMHSFVAQAYYYESRYQDLEEEFVCIGIPTRGSNEGYTAQITSYGGVIANSPYIQYGYEFLKCLADSKTFMYLDVSVNKLNAVEEIQELTSLVYELYPSIGTFSPEKEPEGADWLGESYQIAPLSEDMAEYLIYLLEHIECAKLPEGTLNEIISLEIENYIFGNTNTVEEAYIKASQQLELLGYIK